MLNSWECLALLNFETLLMLLYSKPFSKKPLALQYKNYSLSLMRYYPVIIRKSLIIFIMLTYFLIGFLFMSYFNYFAPEYPDQKHHPLEGKPW